MIAAIPLIHKIVGGFMLSVTLLLFILLQAEKRHSGKLESQNTKLAAQLNRITIARDEQKAVSTRTVEKARIIYRDADNVARRIEAAPVAGKCETPAIVMGADL